MSKKCIGCGIELQNNKKDALGYVESMDHDMCKRCFRLKHYHEVPVNNSIEMENLLHKIQNKKGLSFFFVDVLEISREAISYFQKLKGEKILVISKCDVLPKSISLNKIAKWLVDVFDVQNKIIFVRKNSLSSLKKILDEMENSSYSSYYFLGMTNAGKSTLLNALLKYSDDIKSSIVESEFPNTTLDFIEINFSLGKIFDSAGFFYPVISQDATILKKSQSKDEIRPMIYPLKKDAALLIEGIIEIEAQEECSVVCVCSNALDIKKVYNCSKKEDSISLTVKPKNHLLLKGIGIFYFKKEANIVLRGVKDNSYEIIPSFMGGLS